MHLVSYIYNPASKKYEHVQTQHITDDEAANMVHYFKSVQQMLTSFRYQLVDKQNNLQEFSTGTPNILQYIKNFFS